MAKVSDNRLQFLLNALCKRYGMNPILLVFDKNALIQTGAIGEYQYDKIVIDDTATDADKIVALYHEFRHYWQYRGPSAEYCEIYLWWMNPNNHDSYNKYYDCCVCSIEEDARAFGYSHGKKNREDLLDMYDAQMLEDMKANGTIEWANNCLGRVDWHAYLK